MARSFYKLPGQSGIVPEMQSSTQTVDFLRSCLPAEVCRREKHLKEPLTFSPLCHYSKSSRLRKHWLSGRGTPYSGFFGQ